MVKIVNDTNTIASVNLAVTDSIIRHPAQAQQSAPKINISSIEASLAVNTRVDVIRQSTRVCSVFTNVTRIANECSSINQFNGSTFTFSFTGEGMVNIRLVKVDGFVAAEDVVDVPSTAEDYVPLGFTWILV